MIRIDFYPNSVIEAFDANAEVNDTINNIESLSLPEHEDISHELDKYKKEIDSLTNHTLKATKNMNSEISRILNNDFEYKFDLYVKLLSKDLTDEQFPISEWIEEKKKINESFNYNSFNYLIDAIKESENEDTKNILINEYLTIMKGCLNSSISFKNNIGASWAKDIHNLIKDFSLDEKKIFEDFKEKIYKRENEILNITSEFSQTNYWHIYILLQKINDNASKIESFLMPIEEKEISNFVTLLEKTDFFLKRDYLDRIKSFKKEQLRETLVLCENKEIRENFFPEYLRVLKKINNRLYLEKEQKEIFEHVIEELTKGHQYLTLMDKLDKKMVTTKKTKI